MLQQQSACQVLMFHSQQILLKEAWMETLILVTQLIFLRLFAVDFLFFLVVKQGQFVLQTCNWKSSSSKLDLWCLVADVVCLPWQKANTFFSPFYFLLPAPDGPWESDSRPSNGQCYTWPCVLFSSPQQHSGTVQFLAHHRGLCRSKRCAGVQAL